MFTNQWPFCRNTSKNSKMKQMFQEPSYSYIINISAFTSPLLLFRSVTRSYYRNSVGGLLVFDVGNRDSFEHVRDWYAEVCEHVMPHAMIFILVGHKSDRELGEERTVTKDEAEKLAALLGIPYVEASAKSGENITTCFEVLTQRIYQGLQSGEVRLREGWDGIKSSAIQAQQLQNLQDSEQTQEKKQCC